MVKKYPTMNQLKQINKMEYIYVLQYYCKELIYLSIALGDEGVAGDEVGHDALGPGLHALPVVERHHQLPQMTFTTWSKIF
jgi:hypothetical protein